MERDGKKEYSFDLVTTDCRFTDDTVLTIAVADTILNQKDYAETLQEYALRYPDAGYGGNFRKWMKGEIIGPYNSWGNGSAMRVSSVGWLFNDIETVRAQAITSAAVTHNHPEGMKGAEAIASAIFVARQGGGKDDIRRYVKDSFGYRLDRTIEEIRPDYTFDVSCQGSIPEAIIAFLDSSNLVDAIRLAVSLGGDTDTQAAMAGGIAEAFYGPLAPPLQEVMEAFLPDEFLDVLAQFDRAQQVS